MAEVQNIQEALDHFESLVGQNEEPDADQFRLACESIVRYRLELDSCIVIGMPDDFSKDPAWQTVMEGSEAHCSECNGRIVHCH